MREIKFRAWDKTLNMIHCWSAIENHFTLEELLDTNFFEAMQYTGMKDKNGIEIYEGDIVKDRFENIFKVSFNPEFCAYFLYPKEDPEEFMAIYPKIILTVIGNRYENPELLEG